MFAERLQWSLSLCRTSRMMMMMMCVRIRIRICICIEIRMWWCEEGGKEWDTGGIPIHPVATVEVEYREAGTRTDRTMMVQGGGFHRSTALRPIPMCREVGQESFEFGTRLAQGGAAIAVFRPRRVLG